MSSSPQRSRRKRTDTGSTLNFDYVAAPETRRRRETTSSAQSGMTFESAEEEWEGGEEIRGEDDSTQRKRKKRDEPMSPVVVVLYVTALYVIFQILTRSDDLEILSHLPPTSSLFSSSSPLGLGGSNLHSGLSQSHQYQMPYHLPQISSPIPPTASDNPNMSFGRLILGVVVYPLYLIITILAIPMPLLLNTLHLIITVLTTILFPITSGIRFLLKTFVVAPLGVVRSILSVFYPLYTFVGGVVGFGCIMGLGAGWLGRIGMDVLVYNRQKSKKPKLSKNRSSKRSITSYDSIARPSRRRDRERDDEEGRSRLKINTHSTRRISDSGSEHILTPSVSARPTYFETERDIRKDRERRDRLERMLGKKAEYDHIELAGFEDGLSYRDARGTGREPHVLGTRRRTHAFGGR